MYELYGATRWDRDKVKELQVLAEKSFDVSVAISFFSSQSRSELKSVLVSFFRPLSLITLMKTRLMTLSKTSFIEFVTIQVSRRISRLLAEIVPYL